MKRFLCVHLINWPIQRLVAEQPELRRQFVLLFRRDSRRGQVVAAASPLALRNGVELEMPLSEARSLLRRAVQQQKRNQGGASERSVKEHHARRLAQDQQSRLATGGEVPSPAPVTTPFLQSELDGHSRHQLRMKATPGTKVHPRIQHAHLSRQATSLSQWEQTAKDSVVEPRQPRQTRQGRQENMQKQGPDVMASMTTDKPERPFFVFEHNPIKDREALQDLSESLSEFSPIVGLDPAPQPECLLLEITGVAHLFGDLAGLETRLAERVGQQCAQQQLHARVGAADTPRLAWAAARFLTNSQQPVSILPSRARAERPEKTVCPADSTPSDESGLSLANRSHSVPGGDGAWQQLPIEAYRFSNHINTTLRQLGLTTVGDLLRVPRAHLTSRFGKELLLAMDQFTGAIEEPIVAYRPEPDFRAEQYLEFPTNDRETIEVILTRLVEQICQSMKTEQKGALEWQVELNCVEALPVRFQVHLFQPSATAAHVVALSQMQLESALQPHASRSARRGVAGSAVRSPKHKSVRCASQLLVQEVVVVVPNSVLLVERQRKLFDENPELDRQALAHLINRLTSRLGKERVLYPRFQSGAQPEYGVRYYPLADPHRRSTPRKATGSHVIFRPLRLLNPPVRLPVPEPFEASGSLKPNREVEASPEQRWAGLVSQPPRQFTFQQRTHTVLQQCGPERIETGWWRGPTVRRDYWRVETDSGHQFWLYLDLRSRHWFLHGEF